jgi:hypothetical protein
VDEGKWLSCTDSKLLLGPFSFRGEIKDQHFFSACVRRVWCFLTDERSRTAVELAELPAVSRLPRLMIEEEVAAAHSATEEARRTAEQSPGDHGRSRWYAAQAAEYALGLFHGITDAAALAAEAVGASHPGRRGLTAYAEEREVQVRLLRDIYGNPFRPVSLDPAWLTPTVCSLAHAAYEERLLPSGHLDNARLAILADALEEAGCTEAAILDHLRSAGPPVRGCWPIDLVTGR